MHMATIPKRTSIIWAFAVSAILSSLTCCQMWLSSRPVDNPLEDIVNLGCRGILMKIKMSHTGVVIDSPDILHGIEAIAMEGSGKMVCTEVKGIEITDSRGNTTECTAEYSTDHDDNIEIFVPGKYTEGSWRLYCVQPLDPSERWWQVFLQILRTK